MCTHTGSAQNYGNTWKIQTNLFSYGFLNAVPTHPVKFGFVQLLSNSF